MDLNFIDHQTRGYQTTVESDKSNHHHYGGGHFAKLIDSTGAYLRLNWCIQPKVKEFDNALGMWYFTKLGQTHNAERTIVPA